jgi:hypothetical protein
MGARASDQELWAARLVTSSSFDEPACWDSQSRRVQANERAFEDEGGLWMLGLDAIGILARIRQLAESAMAAKGATLVYWA